MSFHLDEVGFAVHGGGDHDLGFNGWYGDLEATIEDWKDWFIEHLFGEYISMEYNKYIEYHDLEDSVERFNNFYEQTGFPLARDIVHFNLFLMIRRAHSNKRIYDKAIIPFITALAELDVPEGNNILSTFLHRLDKEKDKTGKPYEDIIENVEIIITTSLL